MPELPEAETIVRSLSTKITGLRIKSYYLLDPGLLKENSLIPLESLTDKKIIKVRRRGKMIFIDLEGDLTLAFHLKMTGRLIWKSAENISDKHTRLIIKFHRTENELHFQDMRKFGFIYLFSTSKELETPWISSLGPEPLKIKYAAFSNLFRSRKRPVKCLLLDQKFLAGIGNIYADEILFRAKIHPKQKSCSLSERDKKKLWRSMRRVLFEAVELRGSSVRNYIDSNGERGAFQDFHRVYGREGLPCLECGTKIRRIRLGGRSSFFCPQCQKL